MLYHEVVTHGIPIWDEVNVGVSSMDLEQGALKLTEPPETVEADLFLDVQMGVS
jgi:hypothetical protein